MGWFVKLQNYGGDHDLIEFLLYSIARVKFSLKVFILPRVAALFIHKEKQRGCPLLGANRYTHIYITYIHTSIYSQKSQKEIDKAKIVLPYYGQISEKLKQKNEKNCDSLQYSKRRQLQVKN